MKIIILKETDQGEFRVAGTPETVKKLVQAGFEVVLEAGAGIAAGFLDSEYAKVGAKVEPLAASLFKEANLVLKVRKLSIQNLKDIKEGTVCVSLVRPLKPAGDEFFKALLSRKITYFAMELIPRIARAQKLDALSSQAGVAGYKAVLLAANTSGKLFPMMITAAGTVQPARVLVIGAGVAGLQAIATAKRLGAIVEAFDTRKAVKDQIESLGGRFLELTIEENAEDSRGYATEVTKQTHEKELELIAAHAKISDVIITTALIPGKKAPVLITEEIVKQMKPGAVIVDLAAERGGNCPLAEADKEVVQYGVRIIGYTNLPSLMAHEASQLYARNVTNLILEFWKDSQLKLDLQDEVAKNTLLTHAGEIVSPIVKEAIDKGGEV